MFPFVTVNICHHFLSNLSCIFPPQVVVRGRKPNNWTANKAEIQKGFLLHVTSVADLKTVINEKVAWLQKFRKPLSFNPLAAIVGKDLQNVEKCFVVIQPSNLYEVESPAEAIDLTFKAVHALCLEYALESKNMWLLLQQKVYGIHTEWDEVPPALIPFMKFFTL
ncbi:hypothetical protein ONE63_003467 [Megalurothrips usitatus]|uniref:Uncharacterized protein n=1 Tax=Megalurothrips usitatus TaxID=439358 RepID=A0AAV7XBD2_9NEOP|nr:hypothetical protein ONE63_003467 [Megalurothrips usitatus]